VSIDEESAGSERPLLLFADLEEGAADEAVTAIAAALAAGGVADELRRPLARYGALLLHARKKINVTGAKDPAAVAAHLLDALTIVRFVRSPLVDIGSGGGLPGIPLAIATGAELTCVEATLKKARFLGQAMKELGIAGRVVAERAEVAGQDATLRGRFAAVTARALGGVTTVLELTVPFLAVGGVAVLQRAPLTPSERIAAADAALVLGGAVIAEELISEGRSVLVVEKRTPTQRRFPRRTGIPASKPLMRAGGPGAARE
jgi:16S rRNA (guanine527-N7)-methyltransferase